MTMREKSGVRKRRLLKNTISSLLFQITSIICGFIVPHLLLQKYGSDANGLVNSVKQFLGFISFLELGVGAVVQSSLYQPLAEMNEILTSQIIVSASKFFKKLAVVLLCYVISLMFVYPYIVEEQFSHMFSSMMILILSISSFAQYYFGIVDQLLLTADQKGYIQYNVQIATLIANVIACFILVKFDCSIHLVMLAISLIYLVRPIFLRKYVKQHYNIDYKIAYESEPIRQKWNGVAQHIAAVILDGTDTIVLTVLATLADISVYSVYHLIVYGVMQLFLSLTKGIQALLGELWVTQELNTLKKTFSWLEWLLHSGVILIFGCTSVLIVPFVKVYTRNLTDVEYIVPLFAFLITLAHAIHAIRLPYNLMILAGNHYKETQSNYCVAAILNILISVLTIKACGLVGVAIGTLTALGYQTIWMALYNSKNLVCWPFRNFVKQILVDLIVFIISYFITCRMEFHSINYVSWFVLAIKVFVIWLIVSVLANAIFYREHLICCIDRIKSFFRGIDYESKKQEKY